MLIAKIGVAAAFIAVLLKYGQLDFSSISGVFTRPDLFVPALLCLFSGILISGCRWWILLKIAGCNIHLNTVLHLQLMGSFFSTYLPGAAGGDIVRGFHLFRIMESGRSVALLSIIADRIFALLGLLSAAGLASLLFPVTLAHNPALEIYIVLIKSVVCGAIAAFVLSLFLIWLALRFSLLRYIPAPIQGYLNPFVSTALIYKKRWKMLVLCWAISLIASGIVVAGMVFVASIFSYAAAPAVTAIAGVFGNVFSVIPITPGGIGVGESMFAKICADLTGRVAPFATIYFTFRIGMFIVNIPGMILSIFFNRNKHRSMMGEPVC